MSIQSACQKTKACMLLSFWTTNVTWLAGSSSLAVVGCWTAAAMTRSNMRTTYMTFVYKLCATTLLSIWCWQELWAQFMWETIGATFAALTSVWYSAVLSLFISYQHNFYNGVWSWWNEVQCISWIGRCFLLRRDSFQAITNKGGKVVLVPEAKFFDTLIVISTCSTAVYLVTLEARKSWYNMTKYTEL